MYFANPFGPTRRQFLAQAGATALASLVPNLWAQDPTAKPARPRVAAVFTELRFRSHAFNILENFLEPSVFRGQKTESGMDVVSFYVDQFPPNDMARDVSRRYGIPIYKTIAEALCQGGRKLDVDAVLLIGEHGAYPYNELGQHEYPRKQFFDQIAAVVATAGRGVPVFNDKHLSYRWDWAKEMYDTSRKLGITLMAGSSVPLAQRMPMIDLPTGAKIAEAVSVHGGGLESYDFHGLEVLQSMVEGRAGGETGVSRVQFLAGDALRKAADDGRWSPALMRAALAAEGTARNLPAEKLNTEPTHGILIEYKDGLKGTVLKVGGSSTRWNFACRIQGEPEPRATHFFTGPWGNRNLFMGLSHAIQYLFRENKPPYSVERTLLTGGILDASMHSRHQQSSSLATPQLEFAYQPVDFRSQRETGESWKVITADTPEPKEILPGGIARLISR